MNNTSISIIKIQFIRLAVQSVFLALFLTTLQICVPALSSAPFLSTALVIAVFWISLRWHAAWTIVLFGLALLVRSLDDSAASWSEAIYASTMVVLCVQFRISLLSVEAFFRERLVIANQANDTKIDRISRQMEFHPWNTLFRIVGSLSSVIAAILLVGVSPLGIRYNTWLRIDQNREWLTQIVPTLLLAFLTTHVLVQRISMRHWTPLIARLRLRHELMTWFYRDAIKIAKIRYNLEASRKTTAQTSHVREK